MRLVRTALEHHCSGRPQEAAAHYEAAYQLGGLDVDLLMNWSIALRQLDRLADALQVCDVALQNDARSKAAHGHRGDLLLQAGALPDAIEAYQAALSIDPQFLPALRNLANVCIRVGKIEDAERALTRASALEPESVPLLADLAGLRHQLGLREPALQAATHAVTLDPLCVPAQYNRGLILESMCRYEEAIAAFEAVLAVDPSHIEARFSSALIHLRFGRFKQGWPLYEARKLRTAFDRNHVARRQLPAWRGLEDPLPNDRILVIAEQGLGDTLQFCRFVPRLAHLGTRPTLVVQDPLVSIIRRSLDVPVASRDQLPELEQFDCYVDLLSLPGILGEPLGPSEQRTTPPYLRADPQRAAEWGERFKAVRRPLVGLMWRGRRNPAMAERSLLSSELFAVLPKHATYFALQQNVRLHERADAQSVGIDLWACPNLDFEDAAAVIVNVDLVITVDTSVAHLAGGLGQTTWLLLPDRCDWRWGHSLGPSYSYSSVRMFKNRFGDLSAPHDLLQTLKAAIQDRISTD